MGGAKNNGAYEVFPRLTSPCFGDTPRFLAAFYADVLLTTSSFFCCCICSTINRPGHLFSCLTLHYDPFRSLILWKSQHPQTILNPVLPQESSRKVTNNQSWCLVF